MKNFNYFVTISTIIFYSSLNEQWVKTNNTYLGTVSSFAVSGTDLFPGNDGGGVFPQQGLSWTAVNEGLTNSVVNALLVYNSNFLPDVIILTK